MYPVDYNLCSKLAHGFAKTTGLPYDDLFQEACLVWVKTIMHSDDYDPERGTFQAYATCVLKSRLLNFVHKERQHSGPLEALPTEDHFLSPEASQEDRAIFWSRVSRLSREAQYLIREMLANPGSYLGLGPRKASRELMSLLTSQGVSHRRAKDVVKEVRSMVP